MRITKLVSFDLPTRSCPFCASEEIRHNLGLEDAENDEGYTVKQHYVYCSDCCATGPKAENEEQAIILWNDTRGFNV